jgi:hypothetical protein
LHTPLWNIGVVARLNILITAIDFFVVLPSFVITLNPRDWRDRQVNTAATYKNTAPLFACGSETNDSHHAPCGVDLRERRA